MHVKIVSLCKIPTLINEFPSLFTRYLQIGMFIYFFQKGVYIYLCYVYKISICLYQFILHILILKQSNYAFNILNKASFSIKPRIYLISIKILVSQNVIITFRTEICNVLYQTPFKSLALGTRECFIILLFNL